MLYNLVAKIKRVVIINRIFKNVNIRILKFRNSVFGTVYEAWIEITTINSQTFISFHHMVSSIRNTYVDIYTKTKLFVDFSNRVSYFFIAISRCQSNLVDFINSRFLFTIFNNSSNIFNYFL